MKLNSVRVFQIEAEISETFKNVEVNSENVLTKDGTPIQIEGLGTVSLKDKKVHVVPVNLETASVFYAPKQRGRKVDEVKKQAAIKRILNGDKISEISYDLRISGPVLYKWKRECMVATETE